MSKSLEESLGLIEDRDTPAALQARYESVLSDGDRGDQLH